MKSGSVYWSDDLCSDIQQAADTGNIKSIFQGIKKATGPSNSKTAPIKSKTGVVITEKTKQLERWVEHFSELYSRENFVHQSALGAIDRLPQMPELDELPSMYWDLPTEKARNKFGSQAGLRTRQPIKWRVSLFPRVRKTMRPIRCCVSCFLTCEPLQGDFSFSWKRIRIEKSD